MLIGTREGKPVAARGNPDHPVNRGKLCPKGLSEHHILNAPGRATQPMLRRGGRDTPLEPISWDEALDVMVARIGALQRQHGPETLGVVGTGQLLTEEFYTLGKLVQLGFGTRNLDGNTTLCMASAVSGYKLSFGSDGPPGAYADMEAADVVLLVGSNIADNHPILCNRLGRKPGQMLIVADPRVTKTAMMADIHLPVKPRSDIALLNGIAHILLRDGLADRAYIEAHTEGFDDFVAFVAGYTPERVAETTGLAVETIVHVAHLYGNAKAALIAWTMGVNHSAQGAVTVAAINNLALITGNIGRVGAAPFSISGQCNAMGTRETGFASTMPGYRKFEDPAERAELAALWGLAPESLPTARGLAYPDIIEAAVTGKVKALWFIATNPVVSFPNYSLLQQALTTAEFVVVQDGFFPTPTADFADLVLPAAIWGEKEGTYTNSERRISKVNRFSAPPGEARADFDILLALADRLAAPRAVVPRLAHDARRLARVAACLRRPPLRLQPLYLAGNRRRGRCPVGRPPPLRRRHLPPRKRARPPPLRPLPALQRAAQPRVRPHPQHRAHRRALAHPHQNGSRPHAQRHGPQRLAGDESRRCRAALPPHARPRHRPFAPKCRLRRRAPHHRHHRPRPGLYALPLR